MTNLEAAIERVTNPSRIDAAVAALRDHQQQLDADGVMVGVSREAIDVVLSALARAREAQQTPMTAASWADELTAIRELGWTVAVHNDYRLDGRDHTFWLFTKGEQCRQAEGPVDDEFLILAALHKRLAALNENEADEG
jgi:hypothetical protein